MVRLAKSPPELFPDHTPTRPFLRSFNRFTTIVPLANSIPGRNATPSPVASLSPNTLSGAVDETAGAAVEQHQVVRIGKGADPQISRPSG